MIKHAIRIRPAWLRIPLVCILFPLEMARYAVIVAVNRPRRLLEAGFWEFHALMFAAAVSGEFVP